VHLSDTRISDNGTGCFVSGRGSKLDVEECLVAQSEKHGIHVLSGSTCSLSDTIVTGNGAHGVIIEHRHSHLVARASELCRNGNSGVSASLMATVELNECSLVSNKVAGVHASVRDLLWPVPCRSRLVHPALLDGFCAWCLPTDANGKVSCHSAPSDKGDLYFV
jgi:hypothetical protein